MVTQDQIERLHLMASPTDTKWDLSPNDREAIAALLDTYNRIVARFGPFKWIGEL
jgi:hypothetical protein